MNVKVGTEGEIILEEVYNAIVLRCDQGDFGICMRDGGIVVMKDGKEVFNSNGLHL